MKNYFLGSNTPKGFVSYYNEAMEGGNRLFILKGGSGVGKHTFMKKVAAAMESNGQTVEYCKCSNDVNSLDGIMLRSIGVGIIDGTAPHMVDPRLPACFDEIVDLGKYIDVSVVTEQRDRIAFLSGAKKRMYSRAYTYLKSAKALHDDTAELISQCVDKNKFGEILRSMPKTFVKESGKAVGKIRHIFASAYTSSGYVDYVGSLVDNTHTVGIKNYYCLNKRLMQAVYDYAVLCGADMTVCHSIINPSEIDHILFKDISLLSIDEHNKFCETDEIINLKDTVNKDKIMDVRNDIDWNNHHFDELVEKAISVMAGCGALHRELEAIYIPAMDFEGVNKELEKVLEKIRGYIL